MVENTREYALQLWIYVTQDCDDLRSALEEYNTKIQLPVAINNTILANFDYVREHELLRYIEYVVPNLVYNRKFSR